MPPAEAETGSARSDALFARCMNSMSGRFVGTEMSASSGENEESMEVVGSRRRVGRKVEIFWKGREKAPPPVRRYLSNSKKAFNGRASSSWRDSCKGTRKETGTPTWSA